VLSDAGKHLYHANGAANAVYTIANNATVPYNIGTTISFVNFSANNVTININADTMYFSPSGNTSNRTLVQYGLATALKVNTTVWMISGSGLS
jgi:hypothetical protein